MILELVLSKKINEKLKLKKTYIQKIAIKNEGVNQKEWFSYNSRLRLFNPRDMEPFITYIIFGYVPFDCGVLKNSRILIYLSCIILMRGDKNEAYH